MVAVRMVKVTLDQVVGVVAMRHARMTARLRVHVTLFVARAAMLGRAVGGMGCIDLDAVLVDVIAMNVV
jgi:hypothetical protein